MKSKKAKKPTKRLRASKKLGEKKPLSFSFGAGNPS